MRVKVTRCIQFSLCSRKKPTNFSSWRIVCEPFTDGAAQIRSPIHTYAHLIREWFVNHSARLCVWGFRFRVAFSMSWPFSCNLKVNLHICGFACHWTPCISIIACFSPSKFKYRQMYGQKPYNFPRERSPTAAFWFSSTPSFPSFTCHPILTY